jgi:hypothetical protein
MTAAGNGGNGLVIDDSPGNLIGEMPPLPPESDPVPTEPVSYGNVIGDNGQNGALIMGAGATGNALYGNVIGLSRDGTSLLGNTADGVSVDGAPNLQLGTTADLMLNVIAGNGGNGVALANITSGQVEGNFIGVDGLGTMALPNGLDGVVLSSSSGVTLNHNLISGNSGRGVTIDAASNLNSLTGNVIGSDVWGLSLLGNGSDGVAIFGSENTIAGGQILYNGASGLLIEGSSAVSNSVSSTAFFGNQLLGIDLAGDGVTLNDPLDADLGPNQLQNSPVISDVVITLVDTTISGYLESAADSSYTVAIYGSPFCDGSGYGEGYWSLDTAVVNTDVTGKGTFEVVLAEPLAAGTFVSALATDAAGNSSEFGACLPQPGDFAAVLVAPTDPAQTVDPGVTAIYEMQLLNLGNVADTYTLTVISDWSAAISVMVTPELQPGEQYAFTVTVTVPAGTPAYVSDEALIRATSGFDNSVVGQTIATTTAAEFYDVTLAPVNQSGAGWPGATVTYQLVLTNSGNMTDSFGITLNGAWSMGAEPKATAELAPGESVMITVTVMIPATGVMDGESDVGTVTATSLSMPTSSSTATVTTTAVWRRMFLTSIFE